MAKIKDQDLYDLDVTICQFISPRLEAYIEKCIGTPGEYDTLDAYKDDLRKCLRSIKFYGTPSADAKETPEIIEGWELFWKKLFRSLWL